MSIAESRERRGREFVDRYTAVRDAASNRVGLRGPSRRDRARQGVAGVVGESAGEGAVEVKSACGYS
jgi:hypothetical protein